MDRADRHPLCQKLRELRRAANLSLTDLEDRRGFSAVLVGSYERGDRMPPLPKLDALFHYFGYRLTVVPLGTDGSDGEQVVRTQPEIVAALRSIAAQLETAHDLSRLSDPAAREDVVPVPDGMHLSAPVR